MHHTTFQSDSKSSIKQRIALAIAAIDDSIALQLDQILHHTQFQELEANWRSLSQLCSAVRNVNRVQIRLLDATWRELEKDLSSAVEFDQSHLFHLVYTCEFGMPGGTPYTVLIGSYDVSHKNHAGLDDIETLAGIAQVSAASFSPFICNASPDLFNLDDFSDLSKLPRLEATFGLPDYIRWNSKLRSQTDTRFIGICLPKILSRRPYTQRQMAVSGLNYNEEKRVISKEQLCWTRASFAFAMVLIREFEESNWFSQIRGTPRNTLRGGAVTAFPYLDTNECHRPFQINTEVRITEGIEKKLSELGLIALFHESYSQLSTFLSNPSLYKSSTSNDALVNANENVSSMIQQVLCASRFAHYIKVIIREKIGSFISAEDCQQHIVEWLKQYTSGRTNLDWESRAKYPLRDFKVDVYDNIQAPGSYSCTISLQPHYQAEHILSELRLTTELAGLSKAS